MAVDFNGRRDRVGRERLTSGSTDRAVGPVERFAACSRAPDLIVRSVRTLIGAAFECMGGEHF